jgi:hypothetical protein
MPKIVRRPMSLVRKILVWAFVVGFWIFFYWYQGMEQYKKKPFVETIPSGKSEPFTSKKQP